MMQMICGPDAEAGGQLIKDNLGYPSVFRPPMIRPGNHKFENECIAGRAFMTPDSIYTYKFKQDGKQYRGFLNYVRETARPSIVGGKDAAPYTYPWLVALVDQYTTQPFCSGFIISSNAILTAAHCLIGRNLNQVHVLGKVHDLRQFNGNRYLIDRWFLHPEYQFNDSMHINDIAIFKIKQYFDPELRPCCLPTTQSSIYPQSKTSAVASGWGKLQSNPNIQNSPILQHVVLPIVDEKHKKCRESIVDINRQLCAGYDNLQIDTCAGDSGGPLLVVEYNGQKQGHFVATGIVSYGNIQCDSSISSGIYTRVGFYLPWIRTILSYL